ncbi:Sec-independent protein translocase subunit TatA [Klenkia sp. PcliD-1-E]|uniref:Sec-independent protein translocase subunit TatA n=1 Tax=Klenkia sp. PcliD-1-E TaxID=2954492 RepID=UPI00209812D8|nr:Sec-independent protein translocase subunit TatA [Klenkia sp. PcliD-1-E]MCO7219840.1 Sec-independent protein translocase subunit TatA [Klenkia sp. PcliD-1-E]
MDLGVPEIGLILLAVFVLFGYKKLPDATRSLGRSLRIFKGEMKGMQADDASASPASPADLEAAAAEAEAVALEARARAARARADAERPSIPS